MCEADRSVLDGLVRRTLGETGATLSPRDLPLTQGSRRRRLWELEGHAHCPVIGVCLPIASLRAVIGKVLGGHALADDYELHRGATAECKRRTPIAEAIQRELDRRCALALRCAAKAKTADALADWWAEASHGNDLAGALWSTLTHPRCTPALENRVLGEVHMQQHQIGVAQRADAKRFEALAAQHETLMREHADALARQHRQAAEHGRRSEHQQREIVQLRAQLIARDTTLMRLREQLDAVPQTAQLVRVGERHAQHIQALERALAKARQEVDALRARAEAPTSTSPHIRAEAANGAEALAPPMPRLDDRNVLCVGGRPASISVYRHLVERTGGRFLHHDGGEEDNVGKLDATLAAADLVICQSGCVSHGAYWRVKDHCKRTGKRCVFVDTPSAAGIKRALVALQGPVA